MRNFLDSSTLPAVRQGDDSLLTPRSARIPISRQRAIARTVRPFCHQAPSVSLFAAALISSEASIAFAQTPWSNWESLSGGITQIATAVNADGRIEVFAIGTDKALNHIYQTSPGGPGVVGRGSAERCCRSPRQ